jgi:Sulfatase-modifying factor enzyme 1/HEAT repeats
MSGGARGPQPADFFHADRGFKGSEDSLQFFLFVNLVDLGHELKPLVTEPHLQQRFDSHAHALADADALWSGWFSHQGKGKDKVNDVAEAELKRFPVENVSWDDVQEFIKKLNERQKGRGWTYRLPSEAEWEYACRGAATSKEGCSYNFYLDQPTNDLSSKEANFGGYSPAGKAERGPNLGRPTTVGFHKPNKLGLYDMHGNVCQWCADLFDARPTRVIRGGSWCDGGLNCRAAHSRGFEPATWGYNLGLRLARVPSPPAEKLNAKTENELIGKAAPDLAKALGDADVNMRVKAAIALGEMGPKATEGAAALGKAVDDKEEAVAKASLEALGKLGGDAYPAAPELLAVIKKSDQGRQLMLLKVLGDIGPSANAVIVELAAFGFKDRDNKALFDATLMVMEQIGPGDLKQLYTASKSASPSVRIGAIMSLEKAATEYDDRRLLLENLRFRRDSSTIAERDPQVRGVMAEAIGRLQKK